MVKRLAVSGELLSDRLQYIQRLCCAIKGEGFPCFLWQRKVQRDAGMCKALTVHFSPWELSSCLCSERVSFAKDGHFLVHLARSLKKKTHLDKCRFT